MIRQCFLQVGLAGLITACTYEEHNTYNDVRVVADAGSAEAGGAAGSSQGAAGSGQAGAAGSSAGAGGAGANGTATEDCTGCLRLTVSSRTTRNLRLQFPAAQNLSESLIIWRMRVRTSTNPVQVGFYAQSGAANDFMYFSSVTLSTESGWQDVGADLGPIPAFAPEVYFDAGLDSGAGNIFEQGFPFDKSKVERVGVLIYPGVPDGFFTPLTIEIDSVSFSSQPELNANLSSSDDDFALVDADDALIAGATLTHVED